MIENFHFICFIIFKHLCGKGYNEDYKSNNDYANFNVNDECFTLFRNASDNCQTINGRGKLFF